MRYAEPPGRVSRVGTAPALTFTLFSQSDVKTRNPSDQRSHIFRYICEKKNTAQRDRWYHRKQNFVQIGQKLQRRRVLTLRVESTNTVDQTW